MRSKGTKEKSARRAILILRALFCFCSGDLSRIKKVWEELGYAKASDEDVEVVKKICKVMSERAARLATAGLAAIVKVIIQDDVIFYFHHQCFT